MNSASIDVRQFKRIVFRNTSLPLALSVLLSAGFVWVILQLVASNGWLDHSNRVLARAHEALQLMVDSETGFRGYLISERDSFLEPYRGAVDKLPEQLSQLRELVGDSPRQRVALDRIEAKHKEWLNYSVEMVDRRRTTRRGALDAVSDGQGKRIMDVVRAEFRTFIQAEEGLRAERNAAASRLTRLALVLILGGSIVAGIVLALFSRAQLSAVARTYGGALDAQREQTEELQRQAWLKTAQSEVAMLIRGDRGLSDIGDAALQFVCRYLGAKVGVLYMLEESSRTLELQAAYAVAREDKDRVRGLMLGESLAGQAALEGKVLLLDPAPPGHLRVGTALGFSEAGAVACAPLSADGRVMGVMELAFSRSLDRRDQELLQLVAEVIGVSLKSALYRARLQELLEESQRQAEELQAQQEELRANNEELESQSKALRESQVRLEGQQAELEESNMQLSGQAKELERLNQYKSQFLANMSHELRTPLNSTLILAQLLADNRAKRLSSEEVDYAKTILSSSNDLLSLINDILDMAKVESGKVDLYRDFVPVTGLVEGLGKSFVPVADSKGVRFEHSIDPSVPASIETDRKRLEQILRNLVSNAIKFTEQGGVKLEVRLVPSGRVEFVVSDTGIGIPADQHESIFEAFRQGDGTTNRKFGGTGLGLTISRDLARLLGGEIRLTSQPGRGSTFTLSIPPRMDFLPSIAKAPVVAASPPVLPARARGSVRSRSLPRSFQDDRESHRSGARILLVVEDDAAFAKVLYEMSHEKGFDCLVAESALEAVDLAIAYLPTAIILDMKLPDHSGLVVLDRLKENPSTRHIPVHVIAAEDYEQSTLQMGAVGYLAKPAGREQLLDVLHKLERKVSQEVRRVLAVEDNDVQRESIRKLIGDKNVEVTGAAGGAEALEKLAKESFDCVILDLSLPDMSGYDLLEKMSQSEEHSHPPVIVYTGRSLSRDEELQLQKYARTIILKGAKSPERLLSEVTLFLHQIEANMSPERQRTLKDLRDREKIFEGKTVLLVDDDVRNIFALGSALEQKGARVEIARNGQEAVDRVLALAGKVDLVLMDVMMPVMDGYEATRRIRKDVRFARLPIIAVTAKAMADDHARCLEAGANDYLAKPIDLPKLLSLIRVWIQPAAGWV